MRNLYDPIFEKALAAEIIATAMEAASLVPGDATEIRATEIVHACLQAAAMITVAFEVKIEPYQIDMLADQFKTLVAMAQRVVDPDSYLRAAE